MSCRPIQPKGRCTTTLKPGSTLTQIVSHYIKQQRPRRRANMRRFRQMPSLAEAIRAAALARCLDSAPTPSRPVHGQFAQNGVSLYKISTLSAIRPEICRRHYAALEPETMAEEMEFGVQYSCADLISRHSLQ